MKFYGEMRSLCLETDVSGVALGAGQLQIRDSVTFCEIKHPIRPITFTSKSLSPVQKRYSNTGREALEILHGLEKFHHYCFIREESIITDHKPLENHVQERCSNTSTEISMHIIKNFLIQIEDTIEAQTRPIRNRLVIMTKL